MTKESVVSYCLTTMVVLNRLHLQFTRKICSFINSQVRLVIIQCNSQLRSVSMNSNLDQDSGGRGRTRKKEQAVAELGQAQQSFDFSLTGLE